MLKLYNTESREKEDVRPLDGKAVRIYTCGPTVYNFAHIGNFRTYVFEDLLRRTVRYFGMKVEQAMNLTDVDDKTIRGALQQGVTLKAFTEPYIDAFFADLKALNIEPVEHYPRATDYIGEMIEIIQGLLDKSIAYKSEDGSVYYAISKFPSYGRLSHLQCQSLKIGTAVCNDEYDKDNLSDFVLWKSYDKERDGEIFWESPFGPGRPGWHIECSAMAMGLLGESFDLHVGGVDNMFPHHENEIAQSEGYSGKRFAAHWLHAEHLLVDHKKMSKSLGNFYTLRDLLDKGYTGQEVRYLLLSVHYRTQLNFTFEGLDAARHSLERLAGFVERIRVLAEGHVEASGHLKAILDKRSVEFRLALSDDLNISVALAALFELVREVNGLCDKEELGSSEAVELLEALRLWDQVLGLIPFEKKALEIPPELQEALLVRDRARKEKNWKLADACRDQIDAAGFFIEDTLNGARLKKK